MYLCYCLQHSVDIKPVNVLFVFENWSRMVSCFVLCIYLSLCVLFVMSTIHTTIWPFMCWCAVKKLLTHVLSVSVWCVVSNSLKGVEDVALEFSQVLVNTQIRNIYRSFFKYTVWVKKSAPPPKFFCHFFANGWEFSVQILHTYYTFLSTLDCKFLFSYLQFWWNYAILSATTIICSKCPPLAETHTGWTGRT